MFCHIKESDIFYIQTLYDSITSLIFYSSSSGIYFCMIFLVIMVIRQLNILETDINTLKETFELTLGDFYNVQLLMYIYYW